MLSNWSKDGWSIYPLAPSAHWVKEPLAPQHFWAAIAHGPRGLLQTSEKWWGKSEFNIICHSYKWKQRLAVGRWHGHQRPLPHSPNPCLCYILWEGFQSSDTYAPILFPEISLFSFSLYFPTHTNPQIPIEFKRGSNVEDITLPLLVSQSRMHLRHRAMWTSPVPWASRRGFWRQDQKESLILSYIGIKVSYKYPPATTIFAMCPDMSEHLCANGLCVFPSQIYALSIINLTAYQTSLCGCSPSNSNSNTNKLIICLLYSAMNIPSIPGFPMPINDTSGSSQEKNLRISQAWPLLFPSLSNS